MAELNDPEFHALKVRAKIHAMGTTYLCHPANRVQRINRAPVAVPPFRWINSDRIAAQLIQDAIGLFRAPGFNPRRNLK